MPAPASRRTLLPHEHGAWGQLVLPLVCGLALGRLTAAALLLAASVVLFFVAHEPLLVLLRQRGARVRAEQGRRAGRWMAVLLVAATASGAVGMALAPAAARAAALIPVTLAGAAAGLVWRGRERTVGGEVVIATALASASAAVALAGGAGAPAAAAAALAWAISFAAATLAVHVILVRARSKGARDPGPLHAAGVAGLAVAAVALAAAGLPPAVPVGAAPTLLVSLVVCLARVPPRRLRLLGWALVGSSAVTLGVLVAGLR